jgi:hypothetical protein
LSFLRIIRKVSDIAYKVNLKNGSATSKGVILWATPEEFAKYTKNGSSFIENVVEEGVILYDDEIFARVRKASLRRANKSLIRSQIFV